MALPRILLTTGEPAGIGPDLLVAIAGEAWDCELTVIGDPALIESRAAELGASLRVRRTAPAVTLGRHEAGCLSVWPTQRSVRAQCGRLEPDHSAYVLETIDEGTRACLRGVFDALVTPPVHKGVINAAGFAFTGHTEHIAALTGGDPVMMLAVPGLRVALVTTHMPLAKVSGAITPELLERTLRTVHRDLRLRFGIVTPRIAVCGLNPHAGEGGYLGREEIEVIEPVLLRLRGEGWQLRGPLPADTAFLSEMLAEVDVVLAMYHDQGLPVLKHAGFGRAVNVTLGLPIIRTSVDHGTALDRAGTGRVDAGSLRAAIEMAITLVRRGRLLEKR
ncbi:4-hydroxythreonine-4-phosphate dehydrogenase PdxA [Methylotetracoccus oryzae]|uniref:4-hydroxythreonine-4-phosphate dehydrogenase PdxA n=1 Tax=Methylotetracoccus oryzae TaxID=1919059 RepID=UPI001F1A9BB4|nr:4-hydroxythreonine-4-phosphate dehydrogenase PdxA [Methylotetracoccus oryzae]